MKRSKIEEKLNDAMQRKSSAEWDERSLTSDINYHDGEASRIRKRRQSARSKIDRAKATIERLTQQLYESAP
jgi:peptidoglycan hydrolase CwlO-like protein